MRDVNSKEEVLVANLHCCKYEVLHKAVVNCGYTIQAENETDDNWDLCWSDLSVSIERVSRLKSFQRLNHFPGMLEICRKASLSRHLNRMCARLPTEYSFFPRSLVLDDQLDDLICELKKNKAKIESGTTNVPTYILKPSGGTMGRGISLVQTLQQLQEIPDIGNTVAQAYVPNPLLLDGFKFDMRIYALVASIDPLRIFLYDEGLARLATDSYHAPTADNLRSTTMHLTNYAINRGTPSGTGLPQAASSSTATKRPASEVLQAVAHAGNVSKASLVNKIAAIVVKTVLAVQPLLAHTYHTGLSVGANQQTSEQQPCTHWGHMFPDAVSPNGKAAGTHPVAPPSNAPITTNPCGCAPSKCFEILGFDILFDEQLQPWLLEVNHSPSFACDTKLDYQVKSALVTDILQALQQTSAEKAAYMEHECQALAQRLYAPASSGLPTRRRPLSGLPRSRQLHAAAVHLDDMVAGMRQGSTSSGTTSYSGTIPSWQSGGSGGENSRRDIGPGAISELNSGREGGIPQVEGSCGLIQGTSPRPAGQVHVHRYTQIYPPPLRDMAQCYARVLGVATDAFPDQRCQCAYCGRRREGRLLRTTALEFKNMGAPSSSYSGAAIFPQSFEGCAFSLGSRALVGGRMYASANANTGPHRSQSAHRALSNATRPMSGQQPRTANSSTGRQAVGRRREEGGLLQSRRVSGGGPSARGSKSGCAASEARVLGAYESQSEASIGCEGSLDGNGNVESYGQRLEGEGSGGGRILHRPGAIGCISGSSHGSSSTGGSSFGSSYAENGSARSVSSIGSASSSGAGSCNACNPSLSQSTKTHHPLLSLGTPRRRRPCSTESACVPTGRTTASALPSSYQNKDTNSAIQPRPASSSAAARTASHSLLPPTHPGSPGLTKSSPQNTLLYQGAGTPATPSSHRPSSSPGNGGLRPGSPHLQTPGTPIGRGAAAQASVGTHPARDFAPTILSSPDSKEQQQQQHPHASPTGHAAALRQRPSSTPQRLRANGTTNNRGSSSLNGRDGRGRRGPLSDPCNSSSSSSSSSSGGGTSDEDAAPASISEKRAATLSQRSPNANDQTKEKNALPASDKKPPQLSIPRVATLPARRNQMLGPPLDATIMAMRMHLLSNRFVTPLLIQQQRQQQKRSARASSGSSRSSSTTKNAAWCRPASAQENQVRARRNLSSLLDEYDVNKHT